MYLDYSCYYQTGFMRPVQFHGVTLLLLGTLGTASNAGTRADILACVAYIIFCLKKKRQWQLARHLGVDLLRWIPVPTVRAVDYRRYHTTCQL